VVRLRRGGEQAALQTLGEPTLLVIEPRVVKGQTGGTPTSPAVAISSAEAAGRSAPRHSVRMAVR